MAKKRVKFVKTFSACMTILMALAALALLYERGHANMQPAPPVAGFSTYALVAADAIKAENAINLLTIKPGHNAIAIGAAFGSYYDAAQSACKPGEFTRDAYVYGPTTKYDEQTGEAYEDYYSSLLIYELGVSGQLPGGPNPAFVSVTPHMIGKTMRDIQGNCQLWGAYSNYRRAVPAAADATQIEDWDWWTADHLFAQSELGLGMWLYMLNNEPCDLGLQKT